MLIPLANEVNGWIPSLLVTTAVGLLIGVAAIVLLPFAKLHQVGRQLAMLAIGIGVVSPLFFYLQIGNEMPRTGRLILMSPILLGAVAWLLYPKHAPQARGFEVLPPPGRDSESG
jgi:hypothetical protein